MSQIRPAAVAGRFYPADAGALSRMVKELLGAHAPLAIPAPKALILPHAGYRFSGKPAGAAIAAIPEGTPIRRVVIAGPSHHFGLRGVCLPRSDAFETPLGRIPVHLPFRDALAQEPDVTLGDEPHVPEHSIEVALPFLQQRLREFTVLPMLVGDIKPERLADLYERICGGPETLLIISTDLSHYLPATEAERIDLDTAHRIELAAGGLASGQACGATALGGLLALVRRHAMRITRLALTHSGETSQSGTERVVGYGAWMVQEADAARLPVAHRRTLLRAAMQGLASGIERGQPPQLALNSFAPPLQGIAASFVTLTNAEGRLRGCIGSLKPHAPLAEDVVANSVKSGLRDPRFRPVTKAELAGISVEIALLDRSAPLSFRTEEDVVEQLEPHRDGLILRDGARRATFLPKVWDSLPDPRDFLRALKVKAGLERDHWSTSLEIARYRAESFSASLRPAA